MAPCDNAAALSKSASSKITRGDLPERERERRRREEEEKKKERVGEGERGRESQKQLKRACMHPSTSKFQSDFLQVGVGSGLHDDLAHLHRPSERN